MMGSLLKKIEKDVVFAFCLPGHFVFSRFLKMGDLCALFIHFIRTQAKPNAIPHL